MCSVFYVSLDTCICLCGDDMSSRVWIMRPPNLKLKSLNQDWANHLVECGKGYHHGEFEFGLDLGF